MARLPIPTWNIALVAVRLGRRLLLVQEAREGNEWFLPAGRVELGESLLEGAIRETLEEAGVPVVLEGLIRVEHSSLLSGARLRVFFVARPADDRPPKERADSESLRARYVAWEELDSLTLRSPEVRDVFAYLLAGGPIQPLSMLASPHDPWPRSTTFPI